tara:strand:- start:666 stop:1574 length:909 start_codon:yes stop_codon:yes gene_type:complete
MSSYYLRDVFINKLYEKALKDENIIFISADFGAPALDKFRENLKNQFIHSGISEQHMIDMAAGLSLSGKKVFVYAMAPFITLRCIEQIKCSLAMMNLPVTIISVGGGLSYADAGPTHYSNEDIACLRSLVGLEIISPADNVSTAMLVNEVLNNQKLRLIRLDRAPLKNIYDDSFQISKGYDFINKGNNDKCIITYGYLLHKIIDSNKFSELKGTDIIDLYTLKPFPKSLIETLKSYKKIISYEEHCKDGGFGSAIAEVMVDNDIKVKLKRLHLDEIYYFENGGREHLLDNYGLSIDNLISQI